MAKRLLLVGLLATGLVACKGTSKKKEEADGSLPGGVQANAATTMGRDAIERGLMSLGIEGSVLRIDLNGAREGAPVHMAKAHLIRDLLLLEAGPGAKKRDMQKPKVWALERSNLHLKWISDLDEPSLYPVAANAEVVVLTSRHYAQALELDTGRPAIQFVGGGLAGLPQPFLELPFTPTGGAAVGNDTFYVPSLGSPQNNKTIESFSLISGQRGWGYRSSAEILTSPVVGGPSTDPKLYFVTRTGHVICMNATNYGYRPRGSQWEALLEAGIEYDFCVTGDTAEGIGAVYLVDKDGLVYCLDRVTGRRRWVDATGREAKGAPRVFGDICVVPMNNGLCGFDADNVVYALHVESGPDEGTTYWVRSGKGVTLDSGLTLKIEGEALFGTGSGLRVDGAKAGKRTQLLNGATVAIGNSVMHVEDHGSAPLWTDLPYDEIVGHLGDRLIARKGNTLRAVNKWTGEPMGDAVTLPGARLFPANTSTGHLYVIGGDAVVYALYPY